MFASRRELIKFEVFSIAGLVNAALIALAMSLIYHSDRPLPTHVLIGPEVGKFITLGVFLIYAFIFYFTVLRKYDFLMSGWRRRGCKDQLEHLAIIDSILPAWRKLQIFIIACFVLGILFLDPLNACIATIGCEAVHIIFRAAA